MSITYSADVATSSFSTIVRLLFRWKGSIWKAVWARLLVWLAIYGSISIIYRSCLTNQARIDFAKFVQYCETSSKYIPLDFMLGFFVTQVVNRWTTFFNNLGTIDNTAMYTANFIQGRDDFARNLRRNIARYVVLGQALVYRDINVHVRARFPTMESLVAAGFMMEHELDKFERVHSRYAKYWLPFSWSLALVNKALDTGRMRSNYHAVALTNEIRKFRVMMTTLWTYDWVPMPLIYPQLISLAVHTYFALCLFMRQFILTPESPNHNSIDMLFPLMTVVQFIFYFGWTEVAMALLNPMGEDDDDFDCNFMLDRNLTIALTCTDQAHDDPPESVATPVHYYEGSAVTSQHWRKESTAEEVVMLPHPENKRKETIAQHHDCGVARRKNTVVVPPELEEMTINARKTSVGTRLFNKVKRSVSTASKAPRKYARRDDGGHRTELGTPSGSAPNSPRIPRVFVSKASYDNGGFSRTTQSPHAFDFSEDDDEYPRKGSCPQNEDPAVSERKRPSVTRIASAPSMLPMRPARFQAPAHLAVRRPDSLDSLYAPGPSTTCLSPSSTLSVLECSASTESVQGPSSPSLKRPGAHHPKERKTVRYSDDEDYVHVQQSDNGEQNKF